MLDQNEMPLFEALKKYVEDGVISFHVPGHKQGRGVPLWREYVGSKVLQIDANGMEDLDNICNPIGVIKQSERLMAELYGADDCFFLVNGTTQGVQAMILGSCAPGDEIIVPRNAHKSTIGAFILSGAVPVYITPEINYDLGIAMGMNVESVRAAVEKHPYAAAIFVINPTYYGVVSDIRTITSIAHDNGMMLLADEAHGAHFPFHDELPVHAMKVGADMSAVSIHKTGGSMTQSSILLIKGEEARAADMKTVLNLMQTTSASYVLMASLDIARYQLAQEGPQLIDKVLQLSRYAREKINQIDGLYAFGPEIAGTPGSYGFDETKLGINVRRLGITGYEMEYILRHEYNIQIEMADLYNILAIIGIGDDQDTIDRLINALQQVALKHGVHAVHNHTLVPCVPHVVISPREAYYSRKHSMRLEQAVGEISGEMIMAYPPGIPAICPGERITQDVVDYVRILKEEECQLQGTEDPYVNYIKVLGE